MASREAIIERIRGLPEKNLREIEDLIDHLEEKRKASIKRDQLYRSGNWHR